MIDHRDRIDRAVDEHLAERGPFAAADDQHVARIGMPQHGRLHEHLVIERFVVLGTLDRAVQEQRPAVVQRVGDQHVLKGGLARVDHLLQGERVDVERVGLFQEVHGVLARLLGHRILVVLVRRQRRQARTAAGPRAGTGTSLPSLSTTIIGSPAEWRWAARRRGD